MRTPVRAPPAGETHDPTSIDLDALGRETATKTLRPASSMMRAAAALIDESCVPMRKVARAELASEPLDERAARLLAQVDGVSSFKEIIAASEMDGSDVTAVFGELIARGLLGVVDTTVVPLRSTCRPILPPPRSEDTDTYALEKPLSRRSRTS